MAYMPGRPNSSATMRTCTAAGRRGSGFSMVELLVVIGIIVVLVTILVPLLSYAREASKRASCSSNLRQLYGAFKLYSLDNKDHVPIINMPNDSNKNYWMWDQAYGTRDSIVLNYLGGGNITVSNLVGPPRHVWFCPSYTEEDVNGIWNFADYMLVGYVFLNTRYINNLPTFDSVTLHSGYPTTLTNHPGFQSCMSVINFPTGWKGPTDPSSVEFGTDAVISSHGSVPQNFGSVQGGFATPHRTSHLVNTTTPAGGNILFFDGHIDWRQWSAMQLRASSANDPDSSYPNWYW